MTAGRPAAARTAPKHPTDKPMTTYPTLAAMIAAQPADAVALLAGARAPLHYGELVRLVTRTTRQLRALGLARADRVALVLDNGPEMACAFVAVASACCAAPLNAAYRAEEFAFYLSDLGARALIVAQGSDSAAIAVARERGIPVLELQAHADAGAGDFSLHADAPAANVAEAAEVAAAAADVALILHTSGTTSRPKIVPLSHANLCASARNISRSLRMVPADCGLHVMPMFHIHGLIAGLLAPMAVGSRIFCTPGFNALRFFGWLRESRASWYTAVPTMHQAILARSRHNLDVIREHPLRFMRSSSSSMPPQVIAELERVFGAPLIESYGMTEATHQMTSNPLPPARRIPGSVGPAAGPKVAIMDTHGKLLDRGQVGEVVIRGDNVTAGYENNAEANAQAFVDGWFRTGDQGVLDADGYLTLTGRLKEIINRGGEKISPREVDEVLMDHPAVAQVVTFAMPHARLGEEVAAAVVLKESAQAEPAELRTFVAGRLADYKVPRTILILPEIPKGATGKLQRIGLAAKLGLGG
jgi:acyl-CoA synthetase (AMP-forming)/AMP-acid ligase II